VCTLLLAKSGVKLGIAHGARLADPKGLMAGSGNVHRHVQLTKASDLKRVDLKNLIQRALDQWRENQSL
jgi:hypothetical protein